MTLYDRYRALVRSLGASKSSRFLRPDLHWRILVGIAGIVVVFLGVWSYVVLFGIQGRLGSLTVLTRPAELSHGSFVPVFSFYDARAKESEEIARGSRDLKDPAGHVSK